ncbi:hypothetical protein AB0M72_06775 [Nocardiopsis dassonvillei]
MHLNPTPTPPWATLCPHMGVADKALLQVLFMLTTETEPVCVIAPADLRTVVYSASVDPGQAPKLISPSGLMRLLRNLSTLGQITRPEGTRLTFSSNAAAQQRTVPIHVWRPTRHACGVDRSTLPYVYARARHHVGHTVGA